MKKTITLLLALILCVSLFAGCSGNGSSSDDGKFEFIVGFDAEFPPYGYRNEQGELVGFDLDLAKEVARRNGWNIKLQPISWDAKDAELSSGTINCIWNGFTVTGRENEYTWTEPYVDNSQVVVVAANSNINSLADLAGKVVVVQTDSSAYNALTDTEDNDKNLQLAASFKELMQVPEYNTAMLNVESGAAAAVIMDIGVAKVEIKNRGADKFKMLEEIVSVEQYAVGFKLGNTELRDKVQKTLNEMIADGTFLRIATEWELQDDVIIPDEK